MERCDNADSLSLSLSISFCQPWVHNHRSNSPTHLKWISGWMSTWNDTWILWLLCCNRFREISCRLNYLAVSGKKGNLGNETEKSTTQTRKTGNHAREDPWGTRQKRGTGDHAKDDPGGCCVSSFFLGFCWSYLPIIVECCWTAASRSLSSIVHSPISEHPEKTRAQRHSVQIPPKIALFPVQLLSASCYSQSPERPILAKKNASVTGYCRRPRFSPSLWALSGWLCAVRAAPVSVLLCVPNAPTTLPHFSLSWESEGLITISPPIFDLQIRLMGCALRLDGRLDLMSCQR